MILRFALKIIHWLEMVAWVPLLGMRLWIANVFWLSGQAKLSDWKGTIALFADEYKVPLLPPDIAAAMGTAVELTAPVLLVLGLGARVGAASLLVMTAVIEVTYMHFDVHQVWGLMLLLIFLQGAGAASLDYWIRRYANKVAPEHS